MSKSTRVVLIDNQPLMLDALKWQLSEHDMFDIVGQYTDADLAFYQIMESSPDLVVMEIEASGRGAFTIADEIRNRLSDVKIVFFTNVLSDIILDRALKIGVHGYFLKTDPTDIVMEGLKKIAAGEKAYSELVHSRMEYQSREKRYQVKSVSYLASLTGRQIEVLRHLARGESVKQVARALVLSERAIESHKYRIMQKLDIHDRVELARYAIREGLTVP